MFEAVDYSIASGVGPVSQLPKQPPVCPQIYFTNAFAGPIHAATWKTQATLKLLIHESQKLSVCHADADIKCAALVLDLGCFDAATV